MSNKVIKFPNTPENQLSEAQKLALEMETEKNMYQENIEWMFKKNDWDKLPAGSPYYWMHRVEELEINAADTSFDPANLE